jgi:hypothetical protein
LAPSPLAEQVLAGSNRQLTLLAARGMLPLPAGELVGLQVTLASSDDAEVAAAATQALAGIEPRVLVPFLDQEAQPEALRWFAAHTANREVIEAVVRRRDVPQDVLLQLAPRLPADLQEILLLRQDRISAAPELLTALESNPQLSSYSARRISEYREHLLPGRPAAAEAPAPAVEEGIVEVDDAEVAAALERARGAAVEVEGEIEERTGLSEGQIRLLPVPVRLKLARGAPKSLRQFLVRDNSALVALTTLQANPITDQEVEQYAKMRNIATEVLDFVGKQRQWVGKYPVVLGLVNNPRTPLALALQLVARVAVRDLRLMAKDRNLPEAVRSAALRLYRVKSQ